MVKHFLIQQCSGNNVKDIVNVGMVESTLVFSIYRPNRHLAESGWNTKVVRLQEQLLSQRFAQFVSINSVFTLNQLSTSCSAKLTICR